MIKRFTDGTWDDYLYWQGQDKKTLRKVNELIKDVKRDPFQGMEKPEPLKGNLSGKWSRRINNQNRLIYSLDGSDLTIHSCKDHY